MNSNAIGTISNTAELAPQPTPSAVPSSRMRFQFHRITSRGAYSVCATPMAVKIAPNAAHPAMISGPAIAL